MKQRVIESHEENNRKFEAMSKQLNELKAMVAGLATRHPTPTPPPMSTIELDAMRETSDLNARQFLVEMPKSVDITKSESIEQEEPKQLKSIAKEPLTLVAHQVLDKMLEPQTDLKALEVSDLLVAKHLFVINKEFTNFTKGLDDSPVQDDVSFDPGGKSKVTLDGINDTNEFSNLVAHQAFDEMFEPQLEPKQANTDTLEVNEMTNSLRTLSFDIVAIEPDYWMPKLDYMEEFAFDPGGGLHTSSKFALFVNASEVWSTFVWLNKNFMVFGNDYYVKRLVLDSTGLCLMPPIMPSHFCETTLNPLFGKKP